MPESIVAWYIIKIANNTCQIVTAEEIETSAEIVERWGPFESRSEATAKRVGLIRSGKCQPI
jgi:hypothetical protein